MANEGPKPIQRKRITIQENSDGTVSVFFIPEYQAVLCDNWEQALECASYGPEPDEEELV